ncbi:MAG: hypothetical protein WA418_06830 [Bradyrhizobium sp.]
MDLIVDQAQMSVIPQPPLYCYYGIPRGSQTMSKPPTLTTTAGNPFFDNQNPITAGPAG